MRGSQGAAKSGRFPVEAIHPDRRSLPDLPFRQANRRHAEDQIAHDIDPGQLRRLIGSCFRIDGEHLLGRIAKDPLEQLLIHLWPSTHHREQAPFIAIGSRQDGNIGCRTLCDHS